MTEEEKLLAEAKQRYPVGTKIKSPQSGDFYTVDKDDYWTSGGNVRCNLRKSNSTSPFLLFNGNWAEVLSRPEPVVINDYPIF